MMHLIDNFSFSFIFLFDYIMENSTLITFMVYNITYISVKLQYMSNNK